MNINDKQRRYLKGLAHSLKPIVFIGQAGASAAVIAEAKRALEDHELIKIRISGMPREPRDATIEALAGATASELVGQIGHTAVLYRRNVAKTRIILPS